MQSAQASVTGVTFDADAFVATSSLPEATRRLLDGARDIARHSGPPRAEDVRAALARLSDGEAPEPAPGKRRRNDFFASIDMASNATR